MNKFERVMAAYYGQKPDRVPCGFWYHFSKGNEYGPQSVQTHLRFFEESGTDLCKVMNENSCPDDPSIQCAADWSHLQLFTMK